MALLTHADILKAYLDEVPDLAGVAVHVVRKFDMRAQAVEVLSRKTKGAYLGIALGGWTSQNPDSGEFFAELRFEFSFATLPHLLEELGLPTFDTLLTSLIKAIHSWTPAEGNNEVSCYRWRVGSGNFLPDDDFLTYLWSASIEEDFADPTVLEDPTESPETPD